MKVLVTGATGAIGRALVAALRGQGCQVVAVSRSAVDGGSLQADFSQPPTRHWWACHLADVDVVVNAAGIMRETPANRFSAVHTAGPVELFHACAAAGVHHVIQISALGADDGAQTPFHQSKKAADDALRAIDVPSTIVQPSLVYGPSVASAALFDGLAALPWLALPRGGSMRVQPVAIEDVTEALVQLVMAPATGTRTLAFVGPEPFTLREYLQVLRSRQGLLTRQRVMALPDALAMAGARLMQALPRSPFTADAVAMLLRGNTAAAAPLAQLLGRSPTPLGLAPDSAVQAAHRRHALLSLWLGPLRWSVALMWIWTGIVSLGLYPQADSFALLASVGVTGALAWWALYGAAVLDLALGVLVLCTHGTRRRWVWLVQLATMAGYTIVLSAQAPQWWIHPFGPLSKNLPVAMLIGLLWAMEPRSAPRRTQPTRGPGSAAH